MYTFNQTKVYQAQGMLEILHAPKAPYASIDDLIPELEITGASQHSVDSDDVESLQTQLNTFRSNTILQGVEQRLQGEMRNRFMAPYAGAMDFTGPLSPLEVLEANRKIEQKDKTNIFIVSYKHPDPVIAAEIANLFLKEFINYYLKSEIDGYMKLVEDLRIRTNLLDKLIDRSAVGLEKLKQDSSTTTIDLQKAEQELTAQMAFRSKLYAASLEAKTRINLANPHARIIDPAFPPLMHHSPNVSKQLGYTLFAALAFSTLSFLLLNAIIPSKD